MKKDIYKDLPIFHFSQELQKRHTRKNLKVFILGNFGAMNLGDEAILAGQIQELRKIPGISITVVARYPKEVVRLHTVQAVSLYQFGEIRKTIKRSDIIIVGGGGLINKVERGLIGFMYQLYMLLCFFYLPRIYGKKLYILGVGIYKNANPVIVSLLRPLLSYAAIIAVRDHHSYEFLKSITIRSSLYKDNSFLMDMVTKKQVLDDSFIKKNYSEGKRHIGISLVKPDTNAQEKRLISEVAKYMVKNNKNTDFWFYPADTNPGYVGDDVLAKELLIETKKLTSEKITLFMIPKTYTPQFFFSIFKLMDGFIAMRFHACVFAYRNDIPFAGISYDTKCKSFIEAVGKEPLTISNITAEDIQRSIL